MNTDEKNINVQKYKWKEKKRFEKYEDADSFRAKLVDEGYKVKVRRCGPEGRKFKVVTGESVSKKMTKNKKKESKKNASE